MERIKNLPVNERTVKAVQILALERPVDSVAPKLRQYARERLDAGYPSEQLYVDLMSAYEGLTQLEDEEREDAVLDVMDFLTGWCASGARLY